MVYSDSVPAERPDGIQPAGALPSCILIMLSVAALTFVGFWLHQLAPVDPPSVVPEVAAEFLFPQALRPKPHDRFLFVTITVVGTLTLALFAASWRATGRTVISAQALFFTCAILTAGIVAWSPARQDFQQLFLLTGGATTISFILVAVAISCLFYYSTAEARHATRFRTILLLACCMLVAALIVASRVHTAAAIGYQPEFTSHYEAAVYPVLAIAGGGTCLADVRTQYGCYGEFLAPLIWLTGASTLAITSIFAVLQFLSMTAIIVFTSSLIRNSLLFLAAITAVIVTINLSLFVGYADPYLQYTPVRLVFPALSLLCIVYSQKNRTRLTSILFGAFSGAAVAWNLDTGIVVVIAMALFSFARRLTDLTGRHSWLAGAGCVGYFAIGCILFLSSFWLYLELKSGWNVELASFVRYQSIFYVVGYFMLPLPAFPDYWTILGLIIALVLLAAMVRTLSGGSSERWERATYLAVLGIGIMLYYSGRSHWLVLRLVVWPEIVLFTLLADEALAAIRGRLTRAAIVTVVLAFPLLVVIKFGHIAAMTVVGIHNPPFETEPVQKDIAFVREHVRKGDRVGIVAENQSTLHGESGTFPALAQSSMAQWIFVSDHQRIRDSIAKQGPEKLFVNSRQLSFPFDPDVLRVSSNYDLVARGPDERLLYFVRRDGPAAVSSRP